MNLADRLRVLRDNLPAGGAVTFTREALTALLNGATEVDPCPIDDLTLDEAAKLVGRKPSTLRNWLAAGELEGAYKLNRRDWRIPRLALRRFLDRQEEGRRNGRSRRRERPADLGSWRDHVEP